MRFQCLNCSKQFGWTAKKTISKIVEGYELPVTMEYIVCPYCESYNFEEIVEKKVKPKPVPPVKMPKPSNFDPEDLMKHEWKGKKLGHKHWEKGSLEYGWDFTDKFQQSTIAALESGPLTIDKYEFVLREKIVSTKKAKKK